MRDENNEFEMQKKIAGILKALPEYQILEVREAQLYDQNPDLREAVEDGNDPIVEWAYNRIRMAEMEGYIRRTIEAAE